MTASSLHASPQSGVGLIVLLAILGLVGALVVVGLSGGLTTRNEAERGRAEAMAQAKEALIGYYFLHAAKTPVTAADLDRGASNFVRIRRA